MTWYAAHIIMGIKPVREEGPIVAYENIFLIEAKDVKEASKKAKIIGKKSAAIKDKPTLNNLSAIRIFAGVRKLVTVSNPHPYDLEQDRPVNGTEITYSQYQLKNEKELMKLATGEVIRVSYVE